MAKKYRILVVCGTGIATSTAAENKLQQWFDKKGYTVATSQCIAAETISKSSSFNPHAIVTTTKLKIVKVEKDGKTQFNIDGIPGIPAFNGVPLLTGIGEEELINKVVAALDGSEKL
jgi:PTS system galactitol-specific IIB component